MDVVGVTIPPLPHNYLHLGLGCFGGVSAPPPRNNLHPGIYIDVKELSERRQGLATLPFSSFVVQRHLW